MGFFPGATENRGRRMTGSDSFTDDPPACGTGRRRGAHGQGGGSGCGSQSGNRTQVLKWQWGGGRGDGLEGIGVKERETSSSTSRTRNWEPLTRLGSLRSGTRRPPPRPRAAPLPGEGSPTGTAAELWPASRVAGSPQPPASTPASCTKNHRHQCTSTAAGCRLTVWACAPLNLSSQLPAGGGRRAGGGGGLLASEHAPLVSRGTPKLHTTRPPSGGPGCALTAAHALPSLSMRSSSPERATREGSGWRAQLPEGRLVGACARCLPGNPSPPSRTRSRAGARVAGAPKRSVRTGLPTRSRSCVCSTRGSLFRGAGACPQPST